MIVGKKLSESRLKHKGGDSMTLKEKKHYLNGYIRAEKQLKRIEDRINELRLDKMYPSVILNDMPRGNTTSDLSDYMQKIDELTSEYIERRYQRINLREEIRENIERISNEREKDILTYRYLRGMDWEKVCVEVGYSWSRTHEIHSFALKNIKIKKRIESDTN